MSSAEVIKAESTTADNGSKPITASRGRGGGPDRGRGMGRGGGPMRSERGRGGSHPYNGDNRGGRGGPRGRVMIDYCLIHLKVLNERPTEFMNYSLFLKKNNF